jgi:hypothetical protein
MELIPEERERIYEEERAEVAKGMPATFTIKAPKSSGNHHGGDEEYGKAQRSAVVIGVLLALVILWVVWQNRENVSAQPPTTSTSTNSNATEHSGRR